MGLNELVSNDEIRAVPVLTNWLQQTLHEFFSCVRLSLSLSRFPHSHIRSETKPYKSPLIQTQKYQNFNDSLSKLLQLSLSFFSPSYHPHPISPSVHLSPSPSLHQPPPLSLIHPPSPSLHYPSPSPSLHLSLPPPSLILHQSPSLSLSFFTLPPVSLSLSLLILLSGLSVFVV